ncbi:hypothetical protein GFY24_25245 [Nocardia sp. SYP-A9097]|uniref:hypothetical protein n=1 Tax=Nocardia sp. SYP-A9097 TaxID=2663237 RepID=UPI00129AEDA7|nr:hypothetical protein [Nocardia sp. SYP-A9097]MRH90706.1 hypothetical protein [Nocardia sp. SYP-A9097]
MITVIGVFVLIAAVIAGLAAIFSTGGDPHSLTGDFTVLRYHVTDTASLALLWGAVVGLIALVLLGRLLVDAKRIERRRLQEAHGPAAPPSPPIIAGVSK